MNTSDKGIAKAIHGNAVPDLDSRRYVVLDFSEEMERKLKENDHKGGWDKDAIPSMIARLKEEVQELEDVVAKAMKTPEYDPVPVELVQETANEAIDIANFAMMIWDLATRKRCVYCRDYTGLPNGACENCMNTGYTR